MRILVITASYFPTINGVSVYVRHHKQQMEKLGHQVLIIAPRHKNQKPESGVIRIPSIPNPFSPDYPLIIPHLSNLTKKTINFFQPQIIIFHHPYVISNLALSLSKQFKIPKIFIYHTRYDLYLSHYLPKYLVSKILLRPVHSSVNKSDLVIAETPTIHKLLTSQYPSAKIQLLITGLPSMLYTQKSKKELRAIYKLPQDKTILLNVGRLSSEKNLETLIHIFAQSKNKNLTHLVLVGDGPQKSYLASLITSLNLTSHVTLLGSFSSKLMPQIYSLADIYVYTSLTETQGFTILEAMSAGLPVVALKAPGPQDFVSHNQNGFLANNSSEMKNYLDYAVTHNKLLIQFSQKSKSLSKNFSIINWSSQWNSILSSLPLPYSGV